MKYLTKDVALNCSVMSLHRAIDFSQYYSEDEKMQLHNAIDNTLKKFMEEH